MAVIPYFPFGDSSGGGFPAGEPDNVFGTNSGTSIADVTIAPDLATAEATRDAYDTANPGWKDSYLDENLNIALYYQDSGSNYVQYQLNVGGTWTNNQSPVIALQGPPGAEGNSFFFESETARDTFFSTDNNSLLLMKGLPVQVGSELTTVSAYIWKGDDSPATYDANEFKLASVRSGTGSFQLGDAHSMSSAGENVAFTNLVSEISYHPVWQTYESGNPATVRTRVDNAPVTLSDTTADLVNPSWTNVPATSNLTAYQVDVEFTNAVTNLVIDADIDGTDFYRIELGAFSAGVQSLIFNPPIDVKIGQVLSFSVTDDFNGNATLKGNAGTGVPYQVLYTQTFTEEGVVVYDPNSNSNVSTPLAYWSDSGDYRITESGYINLTESASDVLMTIDTPSATGDVGIQFNDNIGDEQGLIEYSQSEDEFVISSLCDMTIAALANGSTLKIASQSEGIEFEYSGLSVNPMLVLTGTSGSHAANIYLTDQTPEGLISAPQGDLCITSTRADGTSALYIKETGIGNTGWVKLGEGSGSITPPASSVDNAITTWSGTDADTLNSVDNATLVDDGTDIELTMTNPSATGRVFFTMKDSAGSDYVTFFYNENADLASGNIGNIQMHSTDTVDRIWSGNPSLYLQDQMRLTDDGVDFLVVVTPPSANGDSKLLLENDTGTHGAQLVYDQGLDHAVLENVGSSDLYITQTNSANELYITSAGGDSIRFESSGAGLQFVIALEATGTNGAKIDFYTFAGTPEGNITANPGDICFSDSGSLYVKRTGTGDTGWQDVFSGGSGDVSGPGSSVDNALATWNGTDGGTLNSVDNALITDDGTALNLRLDTPASNGSAFVTINDETATPKAALGYVDSTGNSVLGVGDFGVQSNTSQSDITSANGILNIDVGDSNDNSEVNFLTTQGDSLNVNIVNPLDNATVTLSLDSEGGTEKLALAYDELNEISTITAGTPLNIESDTTMNIRTTTASSDVRIKNDIYFGTDGGTGLFCDIYAPASGDTVGFKMFDSSGTQHASMTYNDTTEIFQITAQNDNSMSFSSNAAIVGVATTGISWSAGTNATLSALSTATIEGAIISLSSTSNDQSVAVFNFENSAAGFDVFARNTTANGVVSGDPGDIAVIGDGVDSTIEINTGASNGNTTWTDLRAGPPLTWGDGSVGNTLTTRYMTPGYDQGQAPTTPVEYAIPRDGILRNMSIVHNEVSADTDDILYTVMVNGVASSLSVLTPASQKVSTEITGSLAVSAGDLISIRVTKTVTLESPINVMCTMEFV